MGAGDVGGAAAYCKVARQHDVRKDRSTAMLDGNMSSRASIIASATLDDSHNSHSLDISYSITRKIHT
jgi:hypothetical protein